MLRMHYLKFCCAPLLCLLLAGTVQSQTTPASACGITPVSPSHDLPNMFSPAQEVELGEVLASSLRDGNAEVDAPELAAHLQDLGDRLAKNLPPSDLKFRFYLSNLPEANAFSIAGGRVYVTRKLIGFVRSEDELVGVLSHELGHIVTHQSAIDFTRFFKEIGVTKVDDRKSIEDAYNKMLDSAKTFYTSGEQHQLQADRVGLELLALSGYKVDALADFYDRLTNNKGRMGNWFTDFFAGNPDPKRFREMVKTLKMFPAQCVAQHNQQDAAQFKEWQAKVVAYDGTGRHENLPGLVSKKAMQPPLQDEVHTLRFSYDGKYLLAQDDGSIYVLGREPLQFKFRIDAPEAYPAQFTTDSKRITFYTPELHAEIWDVEAERRTDVYEVVAVPSCFQTAMAPDAKTLACVDLKNTLVLFDTNSGDRIFEKKDVREGDVAVNSGLDSVRLTYELRFVNMGFSLDGRYFLLATKNNTFAVDVQSHHEVPLGGELKRFLQGGFTFIDEHRLVGNDKNGHKAAVLGFPDGEIEREIDLGSAAPFRVTKGEYVLMRPIKDYAVGVLDLQTNNIVRASKTAALDIYGDVAASMLGSGEVGLFGSTATPLAKIALPRGHFGRLRAVDLSGNTNWLAISTRSRGAVWNVPSGLRIYNVKGFRGACFEKDNNLYVDFPKQGPAPRAIVQLNLRQNGMSLVQKVEPGTSWQECEYVLSLKGKGDNEKDKAADKDKDKDKDKDSDADEEKRDFRYEGSQLSWKDIFQWPEENKTLEVREAATGTALWTKKFSKIVPAIYSDSESGVAAFRWRLGADGARAEAKSLPMVKPDANGRDDDYLVEVVDLATGKFIAAVIVNTNGGAFGVSRLFATPDWLVLGDSLGRTLSYSLKTGMRVGRIFGNPEAISPQGVLAIEHSTGHIGVYDLTASEEKRELVFSYPVSDIGFTRDGKRLFALTNDQVLYVVDPSSPNSLTSSRAQP